MAVAGILMPSERPMEEPHPLAEQVGTEDGDKGQLIVTVTGGAQPEPDDITG